MRLFLTYKSITLEAKLGGKERKQSIKNKNLVVTGSSLGVLGKGKAVPGVTCMLVAARNQATLMLLSPYLTICNAFFFPLASACLQHEGGYSI